MHFAAREENSQCLQNSYETKTKTFLCPESKLVLQCFHCRREETAPPLKCLDCGKKTVVGCPGKIMKTSPLPF